MATYSGITFHQSREDILAKFWCIEAQKKKSRLLKICGTYCVYYRFLLFHWKRGQAHLCRICWDAHKMFDFTTIQTISIFIWSPVAVCLPMKRNAKLAWLSVGYTLANLGKNYQLYKENGWIANIILARSTFIPIWRIYRSWGPLYILQVRFSLFSWQTSKVLFTRERIPQKTLNRMT